MTDIKSLLNPVDESKHTSWSSNRSKTKYETAPPAHCPAESRPALGSPSSQFQSPSSSVDTRDFNPTAHARKKQKVSKDAAVFTLGTIRGDCRYPPDEFRDEVLEAHHQQYEIFPMGDVANYPRHIPYNSEKKTFLDRTGRECFEGIVSLFSLSSRLTRYPVLHYNFKVPGDDKVHCMMWDYNIGLVRITPLFKCTGYSKVCTRLC